MYGNIGSFSGIIHVAARRPVLAATLVIATVTVAHSPAIPATPLPPTPPPPAVVTVVPTTKEPEFKPHTTASCDYGKGTTSNVCKATLDNVALYLNANPRASVFLTGKMQYTFAARKYLTSGESKFTIESKRIGINSDGSDSKIVIIEQVP